MKNTRRALVALGLVAALVLGITSPVSAATSRDGDMVYSQGDGDYVAYAASAWFMAYGEHLYVLDLVKDGASAVVLYSLGDGSQSGTRWNHSGAGSSVDVNLDIAEGKMIMYYVCLGYYDTRQIIRDTCSDVGFGVA